MEASNVKTIRETLTALVDYLNKEVERTSKCNGCRYYDNGRSFRCEPCFWHIDCGIDGCDIRASDDAKYLLKRFKLQEALAEPVLNCEVGTPEEQCARHRQWCVRHSDSGDMNADCANTDCSTCAIMWTQKSYGEGESNENGK